MLLSELELWSFLTARFLRTPLPPAAVLSNMENLLALPALVMVLLLLLTQIRSVRHQRLFFSCEHFAKQMHRLGSMDGPRHNKNSTSSKILRLPVINTYARPNQKQRKPHGGTPVFQCLTVPLLCLHQRKWVALYPLSIPATRRR
jgi:hypothetical protein